MILDEVASNLKVHGDFDLGYINRYPLILSDIASLAVPPRIADKVA